MNALKDAACAATVQELGPHGGWLYFAVTYDPHATTRDQVSTAMTVGGAHLAEGPP